jgi:hypothetical protein
LLNVFGRELSTVLDDDLRDRPSGVGGTPVTSPQPTTLRESSRSWTG